MNLLKFLILCSAIKSLASEDIQKNSTKVLSRKRRYLTFPEGSSLQLVYDQTIPIVGIELVFTVGITVALAWELPTEPLYKITQKLRQMLKHPYGEEEKKEEVVPEMKPETEAPPMMMDEHDHDVLPMDHDHDHDFLPMDHDHDHDAIPPTMSDMAPMMDTGGMKDDKSRIDKYTNLIKYVDNGLSPWYSKPPPVSNKYSYYFNNPVKTSPIKYYTKSGSNKYYSPSSSYSVVPPQQPNKFSWSNIFTPENRRNLVNVVNNFAQKLNGGVRPNSGMVRKPYPVFGKRKRRSLDDIIREEEEKIFLEHHRTTRKQLYKKIERFLISHKKDGRQCVLKALCETGQLQHEKGKGTFVGEIMRVIFTLPKSTHDKREEDIHHYDVAHQHGPEKNCAQLFPKCEDSVWSSDFIF